MSWFNDWFREELEARGLRPADAARQLACYPTDIARWCASATPSFEMLDRIFTHFGGDLKRALPDYDPVSRARTALLLRSPQFKALASRGVSICLAQMGGRILNMQVQPTETGEERVVLLAEMEASPLWPRTRGRLEVYTVEDDSLDPYLPHNCRLYVRAPRSLSAVPEGAVCIWRHEGALLVRQLRWVLEGRRKKLAVARSLAPWRGADLYLPTGQVDIVGVALGYCKLDGAFSTPFAAGGGGEHMRMMVVLWVVAVVAVLLCPPWEYRVVRYRVDGPAREVGRVAAGYHFVWAPPRFEDSALHTGLRQEGPTVAWGRLSLFVAAMSLPLAVWVWRRREQRVS